MIDWLFRNRRTGRITIVQLPNAPLAFWMVLRLGDRLLNPGGVGGLLVSALATVALLLWCALEVTDGDNPFRRILGAAVAAFTVAGLVM